MATPSPCSFGCTHDHALARDASAVVARAERLCTQKGVKLTPARAQVLECLARSASPMGAYDILEHLAASGQTRPAPPIVYRALDFLTLHGFVHRIESRNAFLACDHLHDANDVIVFMLCDQCGMAREMSGDILGTGLASLATQAGFTPRGQVIELKGLCSSCNQKNDPQATTI